ncbi:outer membrane protein [Dyadobacter soli]|uniref:Outer membrane protein n=1 Tax=Dyadobacter soli TaxID=659014 RepID=A0A1G7VLR5_9BACT|nr:hypothetical protein [Dyadobacter soli]SDG60766.1 outer membrane protein [Dyadobacter soli]
MKQVRDNLIVGLFILASISHTHAQENSALSEPTNNSENTSSAVLNKGHIVATLNASASAANDIQQLIRTWSLTPQIGYLVADRLVVGLQFSMGKRFQKNKSGATATYVFPEYQLYAALPEIYSRYYLLRFRLKPFVQLSSGYNFQWGKEYTDGMHTTVNSKNFALSGAFGLHLRLSRRIGLEALFNTRLDNNSKLIDASELLKYRLGVSMSIN